MLQIGTMIGIVKHFQSSQNDKFAQCFGSWFQYFVYQKFPQGDTAIKVILSLQYLRKKIRNGVHFLHVNWHQNFFKLALLFLMEVPRHVRSIQTRKSVMCSQYIKKKVLQLLLCSIVMQNIQIFFGSPVVIVCCYFFLGVCSQKWVQLFIP